MSATTRKALYGLIPAAVALLTAYGILTSTLAVLWGNVATLAVGFGYAASRATGNRFGDPEVRRYLYVLAPAVVALIGGYVSLDVALWTSLVLAVLGAALAGLNVDPDEQAGADAGLDIIDAPKTGKAKGVLRTAMASLTALILTGAALLVGPAAPAASAASTADTLGCRYERGGSRWFGGEWVTVRCSGSKFTGKNQGRYIFRVWAVCDRVGWQADVKRNGPWTHGNGTSGRVCGAIGDWEIKRYGVEWRKA